MPPTPIRLGPADAARYAAFRLRMLREAPWAFGASPEDDRARHPRQIAAMLGQPEYGILALEAEPPDDALLAAAGIVRQTRRKSAHRASIWGVYVEKAHRGRGLGRAVTSAALDLARSWEGVDYVDLGVSANSPEAQRLYESLGFRPWGREPESLEHGGKRYDEVFMTLRLRPGPA